MLDILRKYLLTSVAMAPRGGADGARPARGAAPDDDEHVEGDPPDEGDEGDGTDDGDDGDEGDGTNDGDEGDEADPPIGDPPDDRREQRTDDERDPPRGRATETIRTLRRDRQDMQRRLDDMERRLGEREQPRQPAQPQITPEQEAAHLASMTVEERLEYKQNKFLNQFQAGHNAQMAQVRDSTDRAAFSTKLASKPHLKRFEAEVETRYQKVIRENGYLPREAILIYVLGERAYAGDVGKQRQQASDRVRRQATRPGNGRGDVASQQRRGGKTLEDRLENVPI